MDQNPEATAMLSFWQSADAAQPEFRESGGGAAVIQGASSEQEAAGRRLPRFSAAPSMSSSSNDAVAISHPFNILLLIEGRAISDNACYHPKIAGACTPGEPFLY